MEEQFLIDAKELKRKQRELKKRERELKALEKIEQTKRDIRENHRMTGKLPHKRSPMGILKTQYNWMEKFSDPKNAHYDVKFTEWLSSVGFISFAQNNFIRAIKYRIYTSPSVEKTLLRKMELCRKIYNLLIEERQNAANKLLELKKSNPNYVADFKDESLYLNAALQEKFLVRERAKNPNLPIFVETDSSVRSLICKHVDQACRAFYTNLSSGKTRRNGRPFDFPKKKREKEYPSMVYQRPNGYRFEWGGNSKTAKIFGFPGFTKTGIRINLRDKSMAPPSSVQSQTIIHEDGVFYLILVVEIPKIPQIFRNSSIGIDLGINRTVQLSNGEYFLLPEKIKKLEMKVRKLQRASRNKEKGGPGKKRSRSYEKAQKRINKIKRKISSIVKYHQAMWADEICKKYGFIVMENLQVKNITKSAKGTIENPGKNVKQKAGLNRAMLMTAPYQFRLWMKNKADEFNRELIFIPPQYTSQECSDCGHTQKENRDKEQFKCLNCGSELHSDYNAAINILNKGIENENAKRYNDSGS